jgi:hypothetical protein
MKDKESTQARLDEKQKAIDSLEQTVKLNEDKMF